MALETKEIIVQNEQKITPPILAYYISMSKADFLKVAFFIFNAIKRYQMH